MNQKGNIVKRISVFLLFVYIFTTSIPTSTHAQEDWINQDINTTELVGNIANPDRGFYMPADDYYAANKEPNLKRFTEEDAKTWLAWGFECAEREKGSLIYLGILLDPVEGLTETDVHNIETILDCIKANGYKAIVRAVYDKDGVQDCEPEMEVIYEHIEKLCTLFNKKTDAISVVQCGIIGPWGEMHSSRYLPISNNELDPTYLKLIVNKYTELLDRKLQFAVRRPSFYRAVFDTNDPIVSTNAYNGENNTRVAIHNDGYLSSATDYGTYEEDEIEFEKQFQDQHNRYTIFGGEAILGEEPYDSSDGDFSIDYMQLTHASYLNWAFNQDLHAYWRESDCLDNTSQAYANAYDYIAAHLGYRFLLKESAFQLSGTDNDILKMKLKIENTGFANMVNLHDVKILLRSGDTVLTVDSNLNPRLWDTGKVTEVEDELKLPDKCAVGVWSVYLKIPDTTGYDASSVRFANETGYDETLHANYLGSFPTIPLKSISLNKIKMDLEVGQTDTLSANCYPEDTTDDTTVAFRTSDSTIATVDATGLVTAVDAGEAVITATVGKKTASCYVNVTYEPAEITVDSVSAITYTGKAIKPSVTVRAGEKILTAGKDYSVTYGKYNTNAYLTTEHDEATNAKSAPKITITGIGDYKGEKKIYFDITKKNLGDSDIRIKDIETIYTGKLQKIKSSLVRNGKKLTLNKDYQLIFDDSAVDAYKAAGEYTVRVVPGTNGNYQGELSYKITIRDMIPVSKLTISPIKNQPYSEDVSGNTIPCTPKPTVKYKGKLLQENKDYKLEYTSNDKIGTAKVYMIGIGEYTGKRAVSFQVTGTSISDIKVNDFKKTMDYTGDGKPIEQSVTVTKKVNGQAKTLIEGKDYIISYPNQKNTEPGTAKMVITGIRYYCGKVTKQFTIRQLDIQKADDSMFYAADIGTTPYMKGGSKPQPVIYFDYDKDGAHEPELLVKGVDYSLSYRNHTKLSAKVDDSKKPTVIVKGKGRFKGKKEIRFEITPAKLTGGTTMFRMKVPDRTASAKKGGYLSTPVLYDANGKKLVKGKDYDKNIRYEANGQILNPKAIMDAAYVGTDGVDVHVTLTGIKNYSGTITGTYRVAPKSISKGRATVTAKTYTGRPIYLKRSEISIRVGKDTLTADEFAIVPGTYKNNMRQGYATVQVRGKGQYCGILKVKFKIARRTIFNTSRSYN